MKATRFPIIAALTVLWLGVFGPAAAEDGPYPVWWSPALELESLDAIDARLERKLWEGDSKGMPLIKHEGDNYDSDTWVEAWADSCNALMTLTAAGYYGGGSPAIWAQHYHLSQCKAINTLSRAALARVSFVRDLSFDLESVNYLPAMVDLSPSCDFICREVVANERRIPLSHFHDIRLIQILSQTEMKYWSEDWQIRLVSLAHADFTQDGVEDMLVLSSGGSISGSGSWAELFLLTRFGPDEVLQIVNAEQYLCADYQCQSSYEYPEALKTPLGDGPQ
jgi:hypothetical protein